MSAAAPIQALQQHVPGAQLAGHTIEVACSPQDFYRVVTDFEGYPRFVPNQRSARIVSARRDDFRDQFRIAMELSLVKSVRYELEMEGVPGRSLRWRLVQGDFMRENTGGWQLEELADGGTRATMTMAVVLKGWLPRGLIDTLVHKTTPATIRAFKAEAERRARL